MQYMNTNLPEARNKLASHLYGLSSIRGGSVPLFGRIADGILSDPQAHVDALVEAGALRCWDDKKNVYGVVQPEPPHEHRWWAALVEDIGMQFPGPRKVTLTWKCECGQTTQTGDYASLPS